MATIVNLDLGGISDNGGTNTNTVDLILVNGYTEPSPRLLVLRSAPDIEPITGALAVTEAHDQGAIEAVTRLPAEPITGTLAVTNKADTASFTGTRASPARTGTLAVTEAHDIPAWTGAGYEGIALRTGTLNVTSSADTASVDAVWTMKWVGTIPATEPGDVGSLSAWFVPYEGPGFLIVNERKDTAAFSGWNVYDVAGTLAVTEDGDVSAISVETGLVVDAESSDTVLVGDTLAGEDTAALLDRLLVQDLLAESPDIATVETWIGADSLASQLRVSQVLVETLRVQDTLGVIVVIPQTDTVLVSDATQTTLLTAHSDTLQSSDELVGSLFLAANTAEQVTLRDHSEAAYFAESADTLSVSETLTDQQVYSGPLTDLAIVQEAAVTNLRVVASAGDTGVLRDVLSYRWEAAATDTVALADLLTSVVLSDTRLTDNLGVTDTLSDVMTVYAPLSDTVQGTDGLLGALRLIGVLADTVLVGDTLTEAAQQVLVVNAETGAVSTYTLTPVVAGMTEFNGTLYLAGPAGLYAVDAEQDDDGAVVWTLKTGFSNLGTDQLKRIRDVNLQARTEGDTTLQVVSDRYGQKQEWTYRLPALTRDSYRDGVVKPGRGVSSVYYALGLQGIGPAEIDQLRVVVEPLSRRR